MGAIVLGLVVGVVCLFMVTVVKNALGYDDSLDVFGVHCVGGIVGAILTGVFASRAVGGDAAVGLLEGNPGQVWIQIEGVALTLVWSGVGSFIILKVVDMLVGLRVSEEVERDGLDLGLHGETVQ
jgi:Amt family ammonium transporter